MINKKSLWFLTLFSLILVLSVYYITMPSELLLGNNSNYESVATNEENQADPTVQIEESDILTALRVEANDQMMQEIEELTTVLTSKDSSVDEKNNAYEKIKGLNITRGEEESLEKAILETHQLKAFVKIDGDQIRVVVASGEHDTKLANEIMRTIQSKYDKKMYISVKFQK